MQLSEKQIAVIGVSGTAFYPGTDRGDSMDSRNLKYFIAVAQHGSISQAARAMYISQPQLSHIIKTLEDDAGFALFQRTNQGTRLTKNGENFLSYCRILQKDMDDLDRFVNRVHQDGCRLTVSMTRFSHTADCFNDISAKHDDSESLFLRLNECDTLGVIEDVSNGYSDIGVLHFSSSETETMKQHFASRNLNYLAVGRFRPCVSLSADHPLLQNGPVEEIDVADLLDYGFVRYISQYEGLLYSIAHENGIVDLNDSPRIIYVKDRMEQMRVIAETSFYTIGIPAFPFQERLFGVVAIPLKGCSESLCFGIITRRDLKPSPVENEFIAAVKERFADMMKEQG